ncbi:MAG: glycosyltransferase [Bacteroidales bacterium]|nr:glycosyltransferase [Bacteroidales bacterium]
MASDTRKPLSIYFLTLVPFPTGLAQTNRLISIARGLIKADNTVNVICLKPTETGQSIKNTTIQGVYEGIAYQYPAGTTVRNRNPIVRFYHYLSGCYRTSGILIRQSRKNKIDFLFIGVVPLFVYIWFYLLCKALDIKYLQERSEYPFIKERKSFLDPLLLKVYLGLVCKFFDGFLVITKKLRDYFTPHLRTNCPIFHLPILVEPERFNITPSPSPVQYLAYCGSMQGNKDGVPDLIEAFSLIHNKYPDLKLYLIGSTQFNGFHELQEKISRLNAGDNIVFTGVSGRDELPLLLAGAKILLLARPESKQAEGGFPTKLGEYLATGKPVLVTQVGEIADYLQDGDNAFIVRPGDPEQFAEKMKYILEHYDKALEVGLRGQYLAQTQFNFAYQGEVLYNWLSHLKKNNG